MGTAMGLQLVARDMTTLDTKWDAATSTFQDEKGNCQHEMPHS